MHAALRAAIRHATGGGGGGGGGTFLRGFASGSLIGSSSQLAIPVSGFSAAVKGGDALLSILNFNDGNNDGAAAPTTPWTFASLIGGDGANAVARSDVAAAGGPGTGNTTDTTYTVEGNPGGSHDAAGLIVAMQGAWVYQDAGPSTGTNVSPSMTAAHATDVLVSVMTGSNSTSNGAPGTITAPSGMTLIGSIVGDGHSSMGDYIYIGVAYKQLSASGATGTFTWPNPANASGHFGATSILMTSP